MEYAVSERCRGITASVTLAIDAKAKEMAANGCDVVGFGAGEPDYGTPAHIRDAAKEALDRGYTRYTPSSGIPELRKAICEKLEKDSGLIYKPSQIVVSNGAKHSLYNIFQAIINPGDEVLMTAPCWVSYPEIVKMAGGVPVFVPALEKDGFITGAAVFEKYFTDKTKAIIMNSPHNPTGAVYRKEELAEIAALAVRRNVYVVSDEIYEKLVYDGEKHVSIASLGDEIFARTFVVNGLSKAYAMTGFRVGYTAGPQTIIDAIGNLQSHSTSNPNSIAQYASVAAIKGDTAEMNEMLAQFDSRRHYLCERIASIDGLSCTTPKGAFYVMMNISKCFGSSYKGQFIMGSLEFSDALLTSKSVAVVPGAAFEADSYVRMSYATSIEKIRLGMDRIEEFVKELT